MREGKARRRSAQTNQPGEIVQSVHQIQYLCYGLIFFTFLGFAGLLVFSETFRSLFIFGTSFLRNTLAVLRIILGVTTLVWIGMWIAATMHELSIWVIYLRIVFPKHQVYLAMVLLAIGLGVMLLLVYDIVIFSGYLAVFLLFNFWTQWLSNEHFARALAETRRTTRNSMLLDALETYWLRRPQLARIATMMFISLVAFALSLVGRFGTDQRADLLELLAYGLTILNIVGGEAVINVWRSRRDTAISAAEASAISAGEST